MGNFKFAHTNGSGQCTETLVNHLLLDLLEKRELLLRIFECLYCHANTLSGNIRVLPDTK